VSLPSESASEDESTVHAVTQPQAESEKSPNDASALPLSATKLRCVTVSATMLLASLWAGAR